MYFRRFQKGMDFDTSTYRIFYYLLDLSDVSNTRILIIVFFVKRVLTYCIFKVPVL